MTYSPPAAPVPPRPARRPHQTVVHGMTLQDEYFWLRERDSKAVLDHLNAENAYTDEVMKETGDLQELLYKEMLSRIRETDISVPAKRGPFLYYSRTQEGNQYPWYCRRKTAPGSEEEILLDVNRVAEGRDYCRVSVVTTSPDHRLLAYAADTEGSETYTVRFRSLETGEDLEDVLLHTATGAVWAEDNRTFFYTKLNHLKRPYQVFRHVLGRPASEDVLVFHEPDEAFFIALSKTQDGRYLSIDLHSNTTTETWILEADHPEGAFRVFQPRRQGLEYYVEHHEKRFFVLTNDGAKNFRLMETPEDETSVCSWREVLKDHEDVKLEDMEIFSRHLVLFERSDGNVRIRVIDLTSGQHHLPDFSEPVFTTWEGTNLEYDTRILRFGYSSMVTPASVFDYDMEKRTRVLMKQQEVLGGFDASRYVSERLHVSSHDGVQVPVSLVYRRGLEKTGENPVYLYGYGSYGIAMDPVFSSNRLSLLDRGFVFAIAHVRGGGDLGRMWYEDGKLKKKKNTFLDFIAAAEHLIREGWTCPARLAISGGSAGGLLMGAVTNLRPELFRAVVAEVPFVDVVNTMLDRSLPLTVIEHEEWGNPEEKDFFEYIRSYSPYDNVRRADYPEMLVVSGYHDPRVQYWEPAKWVARLRDNNSGKSKILLRMNMGAGHGGASGRYDFLKEIAFEYAFILKVFSPA